MDVEHANDDDGETWRRGIAYAASPECGTSRFEPRGGVVGLFDGCRLMIC